MTDRFLSLIVSCYLPSETSVQVAQELSKILGSYPEELELVYLWNGITDEHAKIRHEITSCLGYHQNCKIIDRYENVGVGEGYKILCDEAVGRYIYCLTDDDLISLGNITEIIFLLRSNENIAVAHQLLDDENYRESIIFTEVFNTKSPEHHITLAYVGYRMGALPGTIFSKDIYDREERLWSKKLYPWIEIAFSSDVREYAIFNPENKIKVNPGAPVHLRFNDRVTRGFDYGYNERLKYIEHCHPTVKEVYQYLLIRWIGNIFRKLKNHDRELAYKMLDHIDLPIKNRFLAGLIFSLKIEFLSSRETLQGGIKWLIYSRLA